MPLTTTKSTLRMTAACAPRLVATTAHRECAQRPSRAPRSLAPRAASASQTHRRRHRFLLERLVRPHGALSVKPVLTQRRPFVFTTKPPRQTSGGGSQGLSSWVVRRRLVRAGSLSAGIGNRMGFVRPSRGACSTRDKVLPACYSNPVGDAVTVIGRRANYAGSNRGQETTDS